MKKLFIFFPPILFMGLIVIFGACGNSHEQPENKQPMPADSLFLKDTKKDIDLQIKQSDSVGIVPALDSANFDTLNIAQDSIPFENETHVLPVPKPTFKVFFKYMKLHNRGPIV